VPSRPAPTPRRRAAAPAALLLLACGCVFFPFERGTPARPRVTAFEIQGTQAVSEKELLAHLATQPSSRRYFLFPEPQYFDPDAFANDQRRLVRYYQARGYYHARLTAADVLPDGEGQVRLRLRVEEGRPVRVTAVEVEGLDEAPEARARLTKLPLRPGDVFTEAAYDAARAAIAAALAETGYAKPEVVQHAQVDPSRDEARVRYTVAPGDRYRFGNIFVAGAAAVPRARIRSEAEDVIKPGDVYDASELPKAQTRVFDLGVFGGVRVVPGPADEAKRTIPTMVQVREAPFRTVRAGPGLGIQINRWDLSLIGGWQHRNWLGGLRKLSIDGRVGYAWLPNFLAPDRRGFAGVVTADFVQPAVATRNVDLNLHAELEKGLEIAYEFLAQRARVGTPVRVGRLFTFIPSLNVEVYELSGIPTAPDLASGNVLQLQTCPGRNPSLCLLSYVEQRLAIDFRDDPINTTKGFYLGAALQEGFSFAGNGASYLRLLPELRGFASFPAGVVVAGRARIGIVNALAGGDVPIVARFTGGGPNGMRGYYSRQLSPQLQSGSTYIPVGGNGLVEGSLEVRFPVAGSVGGTVFFDFGNVTTRVADALNLGNLQYAAGLGFRYRTLFGPLRVDLAGRVPRPNGSQPGVEVLTLRSTGGKTALVDTGRSHSEPIVSVHLTIGEAF
jgi:translocation and assembly module TamA